MSFSHGQKIKRRTHTDGLYIYGVYLGTFLDLKGHEVCVCINPDVNPEAYFLARPADLFPLETPIQRQFPGITLPGTLK